MKIDGREIGQKAARTLLLKCLQIIMGRLNGQKSSLR